MNIKINNTFILSAGQKSARLLHVFLCAAFFSTVIPAIVFAVPPVDVQLEAEVGAATTPFTGGPLTINRIELQFENGRGATTVSRNGKLKARALISFTGNGVLNGRWVVDGRPIQLVNRSLTFGREVVLETTEIPPLPTFEPGPHSLTFEITSPTVLFTIPAIRYFVKADSGIVLENPLNNARLTPDALVFSWSDPKNTGLYRLLVWDGEEAVVNALTRRPAYRLPEMLRNRLSAGKAYTWEVLAIDRGGREAGRSASQRFGISGASLLPVAIRDVQLSSVSPGLIQGEIPADEALTGGRRIRPPTMLVTKGNEISIVTVVENRSETAVRDVIVEIIANGRVNGTVARLVLPDIPARSFRSVDARWMIPADAEISAADSTETLREEADTQLTIFLPPTRLDQQDDIAMAFLSSRDAAAGLQSNRAGLDFFGELSAGLIGGLDFYGNLKADVLGGLDFSGRFIGEIFRGLDFSGELIENRLGRNDVTGVDFIAYPLGNNDVTGVDFTAHPLGRNDVTGVDFTAHPLGNNDVTGVDFTAHPLGNNDVTGVDFTAHPLGNNDVTGVDFTAHPLGNNDVTGVDFTAHPLGNNDVTGVDFTAYPLGNNDVTGVDFTAHPLGRNDVTGVDFTAHPLGNNDVTGVDFTAHPLGNNDVTGVDFTAHPLGNNDVIGVDFTAHPLGNNDVTGVDFTAHPLGRNDVTGVDFTAHPLGNNDVTGVDFIAHPLGNNDVTGVDFTAHPLGRNDVTGVDFTATPNQNLVSGAIRPLTAEERALVEGVFGASLDLDRILISSRIGFENRAWTSLDPISTFPPIRGNHLNVGSDAFTRGMDSNIVLDLTPDDLTDNRGYRADALLIHEITHAWQSQHHPNPAAYIQNSLGSQDMGGACVYIYTPGAAFGSYAAEQIATIVEHYYVLGTLAGGSMNIDTDGDGNRDTSVSQADLQTIIDVIRNAPRNQPVGENIRSLEQPRAGC